MPSLATPVFSAWLIVFFCFRVSAAAAEPQSVRLELLLAVDCSSSVTEQEFRLQMLGIASAFEDPAVLAAIEDSRPQGIAVSLLQWSSVHAQSLTIGWTHIASAEDALWFAQLVRRSERQIKGGATGMNTAMLEAIRAIRRNDFEGERKAIDVSGDGRANEGESPALARALANQAGITVNGLAILNEEPNLTDYYAAWVVGGPGSFLMTADNFEDFAEAMQRKIYFEITGAPIAAAPGTGLSAQANSSIPPKRQPVLRERR
ncbi:DUF1194 domain-containing protein [Pelagibius litoralis]|uniref:DUF1194 domain-containing protein n=1 Tax=Pelagibius litoralis TaxID=374515 RepID=A0A967C576_9PROT|nr:DUF1194 domain-containing protein [Pelagibius litoralis]NIA68949.1 DUF1194 domain-containing protein [Pelagibius litoralis]